VLLGRALGWSCFLMWSLVWFVISQITNAHDRRSYITMHAVRVSIVGYLVARQTCEASAHEPHER
jgi:hypothetical protein